MSREFKTACEDVVVLIHRDASAEHTGGIAYGEIVSGGSHKYGFWDKNGMAICIPGLVSKSLLLKFFNLKNFSEEDFFSIRLLDDEGI